MIPSYAQPPKRSKDGSVVYSLPKPRLADLFPATRDQAMRLKAIKGQYALEFKTRLRSYGGHSPIATHPLFRGRP